MSADVTPCSVDGPCQSFRSGHLLHQIHARLVGQSPWGWRDAVVTAVDGTTITLSYVFGGATVRLWHHRDLGAVLRPGEPARVHEELHAVGLPSGWFNVAVLEGTGAVPAPVDVAAWREQMTWGVTDVRAGTGLPLDHLDP